MNLSTVHLSKCPFYVEILPLKEFIAKSYHANPKKGEIETSCHIQFVPKDDKYM